ncbi:MAG: TRAP transporter TatT component family protein [Thermodesulfobacteriota bacterium]
MEKTRKALSLLVLAVFLTVTCTGCSLIFRMQADFIAPFVTQMVKETAGTQNARAIREGIAANGLLVSALIRISPNNRLYLEKGAFIYCSYGMLMEDDDPVYAAELYAISKDYGLRALMTDRAFRKGLEQGKNIPELVAKLDKTYMEALSWAGLSKGLWILQNMTDPGALVELADAVAMVQRSLEMDDSYFFGMGKAFLGVYYSFIPDFFGVGGGPEASQQMFDQARAVTGNRLLLVDVFEARFLDTQVHNREAYVKKLEAALAADPGILPESPVLTGIAKSKAAFFLKHMEEYFD